MADDMTEAEDHMAEQERWGLTRTNLVVQRLVRLMKVARGRVVDLEARVKALEDAAKKEGTTT